MSQSTLYTAQTDERNMAAEAYRRAVRHSARVQRLRIALPVAALAVTLVFIAASVVSSLLPEDVQIESAKYENGKIVMEKPAVSGRNSDGVRYSMRAERALQDIKNPNLITLENIDAAVPVNEKVVARAAAQNGLFDRAANFLDLNKPFTIRLSSGIDASFQSAKLDIAGGTMETKDPVSIHTKGAAIVANALNMKDKGRTMIFSGGVRLNLEPSALRSNRSVEKDQP